MKSACFFPQVWFPFAFDYRCHLALCSKLFSDLIQLVFCGCSHFLSWNSSACSLWFVSLACTTLFYNFFSLKADKEIVLFLAWNKPSFGVLMLFAFASFSRVGTPLLAISACLPWLSLSFFSSSFLFLPPFLSVRCLLLAIICHTCLLARQQSISLALVSPAAAFCLLLTILLLLLAPVPPPSACAKI